jgi:hypothetical protein
MLPQFPPQLQFPLLQLPALFFWYQARLRIEPNALAVSLVFDRTQAISRAVVAAAPTSVLTLEILIGPLAGVGIYFSSSAASRSSSAITRWANATAAAKAVLP